MANPSEVGIQTDWDSAIVECGTTAGSITLDRDKAYIVKHNGMNTSGTERTDYVAIGTGTYTAAITSGTGKRVLLDEESTVVGPGVTTMTFIVATNDPTLSIIPISYKRGQY